MKLIFYFLFCSFLCIVFAEKSFQQNDNWFPIPVDNPTLLKTLENLKYQIFQCFYSDYTILEAREKNDSINKNVSRYYAKLRIQSDPGAFECEVTMENNTSEDFSAVVKNSCD